MVSDVGVAAQRSTNHGLTKTIIFASQYNSKNILEFDGDGKRIGEITAVHEETSLATDQFANLYVAPGAKTNAIQVYKAPSYMQVENIVLPSAAPATGVNVDERSGMFAITSEHTRGPTEVYFYRQGSTQPCKVVQEQPNTFVFTGNGAFDNEGVFYTEVNSYNGTFLASVSGGCNQGAVQVLIFEQPFCTCGALAFNQQDQLVMSAPLQYNDYPVYTFKHPVNGHVGLPISATSLLEYKGHTPLLVGLTQDQDVILAGTLFGDLMEYSFTRPGPPTWVISNLDLSDVIISPAVVP